jgi:uncharacterized protein (DUF1810 family)
MSGGDRYELGRFVEAQSACFEQMCGELRAGRKRRHWMWFIFPQVQGLGSSPMAVRYGISSRAEAEAYLNHQILGPRLLRCTELVMLAEGRTIDEIFGSPDDLKFRSSMTLFAAVSREDAIFQQALEKYFAGQPDRLTLERLGSR